MGDSQRKYESLKEEIEIEISLGIVFGKLREILCEWDEDRQSMQIQRAL